MIELWGRAANDLGSDGEVAVATLTAPLRRMVAWIAMIPQHGFDVAQHLRERWGWAVADLARSLMIPLPDAIASILPRNMLPHPCLLSQPWLSALAWGMVAQAQAPKRTEQRR